MAAACGLAAATFVYNQPLLTLMADSLHAGANLTGYVPTFTLLGVMLGMLAFVPLGDLTERRRLIGLRWSSYWRPHRTTIAPRLGASSA